MFNGSNCDRKSQLPEILTEPLNPRGRFPHAIKNTIIYMLIIGAFIHKED